MSWKDERDCGTWEKWIRKFVTSMLYFRGYRKIHPEDPFYTPGAIKRIKALIHNNMRIFEWGSGISSIWYARQVGKYTCIEHSKEWYDKMSQSFDKNEINNAEIIFCEERILPDDYVWEKQWRYYHILKHPPLNPQFRDYMAVIDQYPDSYFDCIVVDGRERIGCLIHAIPKLAEKGIIILDDSQRPRYKEAFTILNEWEKELFDFGLAQTTLFYRSTDK